MRALVLGTLFVAAIAAACGGSGSDDEVIETPPAGATVYGSVALEITPWDEEALESEPPDTIQVQLFRGDTRIDTTPGSGTLSLALNPGDYEVIGLQIEAPSLARFPFVVSTYFRFTVPDQGCIYIGDIVFDVYRVKGGTIEEQLAVTGEIADATGNEDVELSYVVDGGLVEYGGTVTTDAVPAGAEDCTVAVASFDEPE